MVAATPISPPTLRSILKLDGPETPAAKREQLRDNLWPGSDELIWKRSTNKGFTTIPRLLPLVMHLIGELSPKGNPANVYLELWSRGFDEGLVTISDESSCAYAAGYAGNRAVRTWREHIFRLKELGFIDTKKEGNREVAFVLLYNPLLVCARLKASGQKVPEEWWTAFVHRALEIKAEIPVIATDAPKKQA
jgi:hypothetical protein